MTIYFVDYTSGNNANSGTSELLPWKDLSFLNGKAAGFFVSGDEIRLKRGSTWLGDTINFSAILGGNPHNNSLTIPIKILPYGSSGPAPIIDLGGAALIGVAVDGGAWWIEELEIKNTAGGGTAGIVVDHSTNAANPPSLWVLSNTVHDHLGGDGIVVGFGCTGTDTTRSRVVSGNHVYNIANDGISLFGNVSGVIIESNLIHGIATGVAPINETSGDGITAHGLGNANIIRGNRIYDCVDGINNINTGTSGLNVIEGNHISLCREHCIWITADFASVTPWTVRNNVISMMSGMATTGAWTVTPAGIMFAWPAGDFTISVTDLVFNTKIYNNTIYNATTAIPSIFLEAKGTSGDNSSWDVRNNLFRHTSTAPFVKILKNGRNPTWTEDNNQFQANVTNGWRIDASSYSSLAAWQAAVSKDASSAIGDPLLVGDPSSTIENARLQSSSPCRSSGANLYSTFQTDYFLTNRPLSGSWDIGADQWNKISRFFDLGVG